jgi:hypothetical protein
VFIHSQPFDLITILHLGNIIFVSKVLIFVGVLILVLGTYATLYAANESGSEDKMEAVSPQPDQFDSVARMTVIQVNKPMVDDIAAGKLNVYEKSKGTLCNLHKKYILFSNSSCFHSYL